MPFPRCLRRNAPRRAVRFGSHVSALALLSGLSFSAARAEAATPLSLPTGQTEILSSLPQALNLTPSDTPLDVIVTFNRALSRLDPAILPWSRDPACLKRAFPGLWAVACRLRADQMEALSKAGVVASLEADEAVHTCDATSDRYAGSLAGRADFGISGDGDGDPASYTARDTTIAFIDTGIDADHVDFAGGKLIEWHDFVADRTEPYDDNGHGTHVASIAAGQRPDVAAGSTSGLGVAPGAAIVALKALGKRGAGRTSDIAAALQFCIDERERLGIRVVSMSLGSDGSSSGRDFGSRMVNQAVAAGLVVVVAAGNEGPHARTIGSPAAAADAITVGSMADPGKGGWALSSFSSRGPTADNRVKPDICAPGEGIVAARAGTTTSYARASGTSMSAPFVAGVVALMLAANPDLTPGEVKEMLTRTAIDFGAPGPDSEYGSGRLDAYQAIAVARGVVAMSPDPPLHAAIAGTLSEGETREIPLEVTTTGVPIAATLIMPDWRRSGGLDFELRLLGSDGQVVRESATPERQERILFMPRSAGVYTLQVIAAAGDGAFVVDLSGALERSPQAPGESGGTP
jgi:serine protease AprX